ncbi:hypothetical protein GOBAR_AA35943 [Gossypium barbadense]|uniref:DUF4283 domain-containing protein n=1 Tax=Gossypium barbadense TaxID=3634 RepID=A0A2P5W105_GOSBA|nr:hypothetical protein GOBAR_AA35943 [Gossypium barbadense]
MSGGGGGLFLQKIPDDELYDILKQGDWSYLKEFFIHIAPWSEKLIISERVTWIEMGENWSGVNNFEKVEMMISISQVQMLNEIAFLEAQVEQGGVVDTDKELGSLSIEGLQLSGGHSKEVIQKSPNSKEIPESEGRDFSQEVEEEFANVIRSRRKRKQFNKRISSMREIQDKVLSSKEKQMSDRSKRKVKSTEELRREDTVVNLSFSDSDISNRRKVILSEAKQTWEIGKKLGLSVRGDERVIIEDIMRLEEQQ